MYPNPFQISLGTLIGASGILGHRLEERSVIRDAQDPALVEFVQAGSTVPLRDAGQQGLFCVAPLDVLVTEADGRKQFHVIELNGTGIGGLVNVSERAVGCVLEGLFQMAEGMDADGPVVLVASSGLESEHLPRKNKMIYEKVLYAEALKRGFERRAGRAEVTTINQVRDAPWELDNGRPTVVLGYMKDLLRELRPDGDGGLTLFHRPVAGAVNDRFCLNVVHEFGDALDLGRFRTMNRCFVPGADKGAAYALMNEYLARSPSPLCPPARFARAPTRAALIEVVKDWLRQGYQAVIKPQGTGLGHGIEFFLSPDETEEQIVERIDNSLQLTERYYGLHGGALPYTVCEFLDTATIRHEGHPMQGHKYELRIVVYRDGESLRAFPSIVKVSSETYNPEHPTHLSLINNITASALATQSAGFEHMLPLCHRETLDLLGLTPEDLAGVSALATGLVRHVLDQVQDAPEKLGLPRA
jgi:hypothetical protein